MNKNGLRCTWGDPCCYFSVPPSIDESNVVYTPKVIQNRTVIIECPVSGVPQPTVTWSINDSPLTPKDRIRLLDNNRQLTIDQAQVADTAMYMCVAVNKAGELRKKFQLEVLGMGNYHSGHYSICWYLTLSLYYYYSMKLFIF